MPRRVTGSIGDEVMLKHKRKARSVKNSSGKSRKRKRSASPPPSPSYSPGNTDLSSFFGSATPSKDRALSIQKLSETPKSKKQLIYNNNNNNNKFKKDNITHGRKTYNLDVSEDDHSDETLDGDVDDEICFSNNEMILTSNETNNKNSKLTVNEGNRNDFTVIKKNLTHNQKKKDASEVLLKLCKTNPLLRNNPAIINAIQEEIKKNEVPKDLSSLLRDVTAYVEVRATHEDRSECVIEELRKLGANIKLNLTRKVTHFIFHNGRKSTYLKAKSWNVHIVSVLWVESCKTSGKKMPEEDFPAVAPDLSDSSKRMRFRNMVPSALTPTSKKRRKSTTTPLPPAPTTTPCSPFDHFSPSPMNILQDLVNSTPSYPEPLFSSDDEWLSSQEKRELNAPLAKRLFSHLSTTDPQPIDRSGFVDTTDMASPESSKDEETFKCSPRKETPKSVPATPTKSQENKPLKHNSKQSKSNNHIHPSIVMTNLHASDRDVISSIVQSIGGFLLKAEVDNTTTHVICGERRRTLSVLFAISKGCWLLDKEWVFRSLEVGRWIEEEPYELNEYFPTAQISRLERLMESSYKQTVFTEAGFMYVAENSLPPKPKLQELIRLAGGEVVTCKRRAKFCIGMFSKNQDIISLTEKWILDSIEAHKMLPIEEYLIHQH